MRKLRPAPLLDWQPPLRRQLRARRRPVLLFGGLGLALMAATATLDFVWHPAPRLVWNASASAPIGLWRIAPGASVQTGDMVLAHMPASVSDLAARRRYLPANVPLLKRIAARTGDTVCATGAVITVNAVPVAMRLAADRLGRPLPWWQGCETLQDGRIFLLTDTPYSFDGRYFGAVSTASVIGKATPLWLF